MIDGNITAVLQKNNGSETNAIGEGVPKWVDYTSLWGWLDLSNGDSKYTYNTKLQESTHVFICDFVDIERNVEDKRAVINGKKYDVLLIDDPMELHEQLEIYLKFVG